MRRSKQYSLHEEHRKSGIVSQPRSRPPEHAKQSLSEKGSSAKHNGGNTSLHLAIMNPDPHKRLDLVKRAIKVEGCDVNARNKHGSRPIHLAVEMENEACVAKLIQCKADLEVLDDDGLSPLMRACRSGNLKLIKALVNGGAKVSGPNAQGETPLHYASAREHVECAAFLVSKKAKINYPNKAGVTPLALGARCSSLGILKVLLAAGAKPNKTDDLGRTPLHWVAATGSAECARALLDAGALLDVFDKTNCTPYVMSVFTNNAAVLKVFVDSGCDRSTVDGLNGTALALASLRGHVACVQVLSDAGDDPDEFGYFGLTPLMGACFESHVGAVEILLGAGANPNIVNRTGATALMMALLKLNSCNDEKRHEILYRLIRGGVNVNHKVTTAGYFTPITNGKNCPLSFAIASGYMSAVHMLMVAGSDVTLNEIDAWLSKENSGLSFHAQDLLVPIKQYLTERPRNLKHLCRSEIRKSLGPNPQRQVELLPLPSAVKAFLNFEELSNIPCEKASDKVDNLPFPTLFPEVRACGMTSLEGTLFYDIVQTTYQTPRCDCEVCSIIRPGLTMFRH